jgi:hypothetical protein
MGLNSGIPLKGKPVEVSEGFLAKVAGTPSGAVGDLSCSFQLVTS